MALTQPQTKTRHSSPRELCLLGLFLSRTSHSGLCILIFPLQREHVGCVEDADKVPTSISHTWWAPCFLGKHEEYLQTGVFIDFSMSWPWVRAFKPNLPAIRGHKVIPCHHSPRPKVWQVAVSEQHPWPGAWLACGSLLDGRNG